MNQYTFTGEQLFNLLQGAVQMYQEYVHTHEQEPGQAVASAAIEMIEGLIAERELFQHGELTAAQLTQTYVHKCATGCGNSTPEPGVVCPNCAADYDQSGVENS
jgi:hypothetical protein